MKRSRQTVIPWLLALPVLLLAATASAQSPDQQPLRLDEAIARALREHQSIGAAEARIAASRAALDEARSYRLPRVETGAGYSQTTNPVMVFGNLLRQEAFGPENFDIGALNSPDPLGNWTASVGVTQPIWTGGEIASAVAMAERGIEASEFESERTRQMVTFGVVDAYAGAVVARHFLAVAHEVLDTARAHVSLVADLEQAGMALVADVLQARLRESLALEQLITAESAVQLSAAALNMAMGAPLGDPVVLPDVQELAELGDAGDADVEGAVATAIESRPDLRAADRRLQAAGFAVARARSAGRPRVGVSAMAEANTGSVLDAWGTNWTLMLGASWNVFDGGAASAAVAGAAARADEAQRMRDLLSRQIDLQVRQAHGRIRSASQRLEHSLLAVTMAVESLRTVEDRYREGMIPLVELLEAQSALSGARVREVAARGDLLLARAALDLAIGQ